MRFYNVVCFRTFAAAYVLYMLAATPVQANLIITGDNETVAAGATALVNFSIADSAPYTDQLGNFQLQLQITSSLGNSGLLQFSPLSNQPDPYNSSNYVFANNSFDQSPPPTPFWDSVSSIIPGGPLVLATGSDSTNAGSTSFSVKESYLLATVQIDASSAAVGDTYQIALVPSNTYFQDANFNNIAYSSTAANITIAFGPAANPAPEPATLVLLAQVTVALLGLAWRSRRRAPRITDILESIR